MERANTLTLGAVLTPRFLPRFALTIDYFRVKVKDAITQPAAGDVLNGCYSTTLNPSQTANIYCDLIDRNPVTGGLFDLSGASDGVVLTYSNLGRIETAGVDFGLSYRAASAGSRPWRRGRNLGSFDQWNLARLLSLPGKWQFHKPRLHGLLQRQLRQPASRMEVGFQS